MINSAFNNFAKYGVMTHQGLFLALGLALPAVATCAALASNKTTRVKKIALTALTALSLTAVILLPPTYIIPVALIAIGSVAILLKNGKKWAHQITAAFTPQAHETTVEARKRILKNSAIAIGIISLSIALAVLGVHWIVGLASGSIWGFTSIIPQTKLTLFLEYGMLGLLHFYKAFKAKSKSEAAFHIVSAILSFVFPTFYSFFSPASEIRLHHSFLGLLLQLVPIPALQTFGSMITLDSSLYFFSSVRGFIDNGVFRSADFMNIVVDHLGSFVQVLTTASVFYVVNKTVDFRWGKSETEVRSDSERGLNLNDAPSAALI